MTLSSVITHRAKPFYCPTRGGFLNAFLQSFKSLYKIVLVWKFTYTDVNKINTIFAWRMTYEAEIKLSNGVIFYSFFFFWYFLKSICVTCPYIKSYEKCKFFIRCYWFVGKNHYRSLEFASCISIVIQCELSVVKGVSLGYTGINPAKLGEDFKQS